VVIKLATGSDTANLAQYTCVWTYQGKQSLVWLRLFSHRRYA